MENQSYSNQLITKKIFLEHLSVVFIFAILTLIITFPVILDFGSEAAGLGCSDKCHMMWRFWWTNFSFENGLDYYHSNHIFYPDGTPIAGNLAYFTTFIGSLLVQFLDYNVAWNVIWFLGLVFGGYGCYLLANNFSKNYLSSIIAGIIFTFTTYHMAHSTIHIGLTMIVWLPLFILFLFKLLEKQSKYYPIIGGVIFFLISLTHLHYFVIAAMFSIIFFAIYIFREKKVSNKTFITNFSILFLIGVTSTSILFLSTPVSSDEFPVRPLFEHYTFGINLENLILPVPSHSTQILSDYASIQSFYLFFQDLGFDITHLGLYQLQIEDSAYLGYSVIFLSALAILKYRQNHAWFWLLICGIFIVISLGPELKFLHQPTGIILPERILYDTVPEWDEVRTPARFIVMANLALAVLVSYTVYGLIKNRFSSFKQQLMLAGIIGFVILFEFSMVPYPSYSESAPDIYEEIKNDNSKFTILHAPIGGLGENRLVSDPLVLYHQIHHEKPIYGGMESRVTFETMRNTQTYFLNAFHILGDKNDIIKQDLVTHGLSLFDYFDIKYVILHKELPSYSALKADVLEESLSQKFLPETRQHVSGILKKDRPIYEDDGIIVYRIPKTNSLEPFLLLGSGWHIFESEHNARATMKNAEILMMNPTNSEINVTLNLSLSSVENEKIMTVFMNDEEITAHTIPTELTDKQIQNLTLKPGINVLTLNSDKFIELGDTQISFAVESISITN